MSVGFAEFVRADVLGVKVSPLTMASALAIISDGVAKRQRMYVCVTGVHGVMECRRNPRAGITPVQPGWDLGTQ